MRTGASQSSPTAQPEVTVTIEDAVFTDRVVTVIADEQIWGGRYIIELDNSDGILTGEDYKGKTLTLNFAFKDAAGSNLAPLWVQNQELISQMGRLRLQLECRDAWSLLASVNAGVGEQFWNAREQAPGEVNEDPDQYDKTILHIITTIIKRAIDKDVVIDRGGFDGIIETQKPPVSIDNARSGVIGLLNMTECYLLWREEAGVGKFRVIRPAPRASVYSYDTANLFFSNVVSAAPTVPNRVIFYGMDKTSYPTWKASTTYSVDTIVLATSTAGKKRYRRYKCITAGTSGTTEPVWTTTVGGTNTDGTVTWRCESRVISGSAEDAESIARLGYIDAHFRATERELELTGDVTLLTKLAQGKLTKFQGERNQGILIAPLHCGQELLDKITVVDSRYSPARTTIGIIHRIIRRYDRGIYSMTLHLGGVASGITPDGGEGIPVVITPDKPTETVVPPTHHVPAGVQAYIADIKFKSTAWNVISWDAGYIRLADGRTQPISAGSLTMTLDGAYYLFFIWGNSTLQATQDYTITIREDRGLVAVASRGSTTDQRAYILNPHTDSILINRDKVMDNLVNELKLASEAVTAAKIAIGAVTGPKIASEAVTAGKIAAGAVIAEKIAADAVTSEKIYAGAVTAIKIAAGAIEASKLAAEMILATTIWAGANKVKLYSGGMEIWGQVCRFFSGGGVFRGDVWADDSNMIVGGSVVPLILLGHGSVQSGGDFLPTSHNSLLLGSDTKKWYGIYRTYEYACPLPSSNSAIDIIREIKKPKMADGDWGKRYYFEADEFPEEMKAAPQKKDEKGKFIPNEFEKPDIEMTATLGVLVEAVRELIEKMDKLEEDIVKLKKRNRGGIENESDRPHDIDKS